MTIRKWQGADEAALADAYKRGLAIKAIEALFEGRFTFRAIKHKLRRLGVFEVQPKPREPFDPVIAITDKSDRDKMLAQDAKFGTALRAAIKLGFEHAPIGIYVDMTPLLATRFHPEPMYSGCSSAAGMCADLADTRQAREYTEVA